LGFDLLTLNEVNQIVCMEPHGSPNFDEGYFPCGSQFLKGPLPYPKHSGSFLGVKERGDFGCFCGISTRFTMWGYSHMRESAEARVILPKGLK
jgi:hypothetical protein